MTSASSFRYIPALDGLRALAVLAVLLYHADVPALRGGFLGVEAFFVISGYLITSLLVAEHTRANKVDLWAFWRRRARRLFPALWCLLLVVPTYAAWRHPEELYGLRQDLGAALLYVTNWQLIWADQSYFAQVGRPSLLKHLWSLAVEEQFYLLWPVFFVAVLARLSARRGAWLLLGLGAVSALWMAVLHDPDLDPSRVYYGSDTRAFGLLLGGSLALFSFAALRREHTNALAGLGALGLAFGFGFLDELSPVVYPYGLLLVGVSTCALIVGTRDSASLPATLLAHPWLVALGKRSYSLYLWHWPVFVLTRTGIDNELSGVSNFVVRMAVTALLSEASYRYVELPIRHGALSRARLVPVLLGARKRFHVTAMAALVVLLGFSARALVLAEQPRTQSLTLAAPAPLSAAQRGHGGMLGTGASSAQKAQVTQLPSHNVLAIGDSVMLGARKYLAHPGVQFEVDAEVGRTPLTTLSLLKKRKLKGKLPDVVIIHLGNNGPFQAEHFDRMMELLGDVKQVVFVTAKVPRKLGDFNNRTIRKGAERHPRVVLVDWYSASKDHTKWFRTDGLHLNESGASAYAALLAPYYSARSAR